MLRLYFIHAKFSFSHDYNDIYLQMENKTIFTFSVPIPYIYVIVWIVLCTKDRQQYECTTFLIVDLTACI